MRRPWTLRQRQRQQPAASDRRAAWQVALRMRPRGGLTGEALGADRLLGLEEQALGAGHSAGSVRRQG
jgi:hypothetical protein